MSKFGLVVLLLFTMRVHIPYSFKVTYENVQRVTPLSSGSYELILEDNRRIFVPAMFTIIEEK